MNPDEFVNTRHTVTGIVSSVPKAYLDIYPGAYVVLTEKDLIQHYTDVEEDKITVEVEVPAPVEPRPVAKKEGK